MLKDPWEHQGRGKSLFLLWSGQERIVTQPVLGVHQKRQANVVQASCWWLFEMFKLYKMKWRHWDQHKCSTLVWEPGTQLGQQVLYPVWWGDAERWEMRKKKVSEGLKIICSSGQTEKKRNYTRNHCINLFPLNEPYPDSIILVPSCAEPAINWLSLCNSIFP